MELKIDILIPCLSLLHTLLAHLGGTSIAELMINGTL